MSVISMKQLLEAGVHFGHHTRKWNPKMAEYIFTERNGIYVIDLQKTVKKSKRLTRISVSCQRMEGLYYLSAQKNRRRNQSKKKPAGAVCFM